MRRAIMLVFASVVAATLGVDAQKPIDPDRFEQDIQNFEAADKAHAPEKGDIVFIGASSIARWKNLAESFPTLNVVNRGFGGSEMSEAVKYAPRIVVPHSPRIVVLYEGENDLSRGVTPDSVASDFDNFSRVIHTSLPSARIIVIGLKPSLLRWKLRDAMKETNTMIRTRCSADKKCTYVDPWPSMIGTDGTPKPDFFVEDGLHMTPEGYKAWTNMLEPHLR